MHTSFTHATTTMPRDCRSAAVSLVLLSAIVMAGGLGAAEARPFDDDDVVTVDPQTALRFEALGWIGFTGEDRQGNTYYGSLRNDLPDMVVPGAVRGAVADAVMFVPPTVLWPYLLPNAPVVLPSPKPPAPKQVAPEGSMWCRDLSAPGTPWQVDPLVAPDGSFDLRYYRTVPVVRDDGRVRRQAFEVFRIRWPRNLPIPPTPPTGDPVILPDGDVQAPYCPDEAWPDTPRSLPNDDGNSHKDLLPVQPGGGGGGRPMLPDLGPWL